MIRRLVAACACAALTAGVACPVSAEVAATPETTTAETGTAQKGDPKRGRITPFNGAVLPDTGARPEARPGTDGAMDNSRPGKVLKGTGGAGVYERMGMTLPALPQERPFEGAVDEAYGAFQRGYYLTAMDFALPRAQGGDAAAQTLVAELMEAGLGVARNPKEAAFWYAEAAGNGDPAAMFKYAMMLIEGRYVARDKVKSLDFMRRSADLGNASAQFNYAQTLVADMPGEKGLKAALPYYEKAAGQGIADAQYALSQIYLNVEGIDEDRRAEARSWLTRAARAGYDTAQLDLGIWLIEGIGGARNLEEGFAWMKKAAEGGNVAAQNRLAHLYVNAIGTRPDPVEAATWYLLSRRAGLNDVALEDFYLGINDEQQQAATHAADARGAHPARRVAGLP
ncbi:tetratricopeptide repeat protein [Ciceribacter sp. sgz301302]